RVVERGRHSRGRPRLQARPRHGRRSLRNLRSDIRRYDRAHNRGRPRPGEVKTRRREKRAARQPVGGASYARCRKRVGVGPHASEKRDVVKRLSVAVIGGGPAGIAAARYLSSEGFAPALFEQNDRLGGHWAGDPRTSAVWPAMRSNTSRVMTAFSDL